jgi:UDP-arabinose 4-epimerase
MKNILVTGGAGYIGSQTCKLLHQCGFLPISYDNLSYGHREAVQWGPLVVGDIADSVTLKKAFREYNPDAVIHFAAFAYVGESVQDPGKYYQNNVAGTINLLEVMRNCGCHNIIFSSTCATYGVPDRLPLDENSEQLPISPYGKSKLMIEQMLADYDLAYGIKHITLRYFNAAGADPNGIIGEDHEPETHLIPLTIEAVLGKRSAIEVYGTDYGTPDGTAIRDYIHVADLAMAHLQSCEYLQNNNTSKTFNLGTGTGTSVQEIIKEVEKNSGRTVPVIYCQRRAGDPPVLVASADKAQRILGWKPHCSNIDSIVKDAWKWHSSF